MATLSKIALISQADDVPRPSGCALTNLPNIPSLPYLISQFLINGFDVDFGEHGLRMGCLRD